MKKAIINIRLYDYEKYIENAYVIFDEKIEQVGVMSSFKNDGYQIIDGKDQLLLPNFVCAHSHIYSIFARGLSLPFNPKNFQDILDQMWWKLDSKIDNQITYYSGICAGKEFIENGVTTIIDHHASGIDITKSLTMLKKALNDTLKLRCILCFETSDRYPVDLCIKENLSFMDKYHDNHVAGLFGMHASSSLSEKTLSKIEKKLANRPIHIHVAESQIDEDDCLNKYNCSIIERLNKYHLINPDTLIVHGVHISDKELDIIKENNAWMVVNTTSNMNNAVGLPDIHKYLDMGIKVMVGNDGLSSHMADEYMNVYYTAHLKQETPLGMGLNDVLALINNAYDYVSHKLNIKLGRIDKDYEADFMLLPYEPFTEMNESNAFGHVFYGIYPSLKPNDVYASGQCLLKNRKIVSPKVNRLFNDAKEQSSRLWSMVKEEK